MLQGSCLCGGIRYEVRGPLGPIVCCHCAQCRKAQGSAFCATSVVAAAEFRLLAGAELLQGYASSPGKQRVFCRVCGSPLFSKRDSLPGVLRLRIGTLDTPIGQRVDHHNFTASKAEWYEICDGAPQFPGFES